MEKSVYLDHAATTYVKKDVLDEMMPFFCESFGNPSSVYSLGQENKKAVELAKERIAKAIGANSNEIYFQIIKLSFLENNQNKIKIIIDEMQKINN